MWIRNDRRFRLSGVLVSALVELLAPLGAAGQEPIVPLQLSFSDPGARSMGFGGAFVALADDATAALANPAGLVQLVEPELSIEGRQWSYSTPFTERGRVEGLPSGIGIDTVAGLETARSMNTVTGLSFLSAVYPKGNWSLALFRHQLADFEFQSETQGIFGGGTNSFQERFFDQRVRTDLELVSYGVSGGYRISEKLALGFGVIYHDMSLSTEATMFLPDDDSLAGILGPTSYLPESSLLSVSNHFDGTDWALAGGFLWRPSRGWTLGGVYRQGPETEIEAEVTAGEARDFGVPPGGVLSRISGVPLELPGLVGLGCAYRSPNDRLTVSFQWDRIDYSSIPESLRLDDMTVDDADELHLGGEYVFLGSTPILAVRIGAWLDPDHQLRATSDDPFLRALLPRGEDEMHYAVGLGFAFEGFQIDLGIDLADRVDTASLSAIYSF